MATDQRGSEVLSPAQCWELLATQAVSFGRLGVLSAGRIVMVPLNFVVYLDEVVVRIGTGGLLEALGADSAVSFEVDEVVTPPQPSSPGRSPSPDAHAWSVLLQGAARLLDPVELFEIQSLGLTPFVPEPGEIYVGIRPESISGRRFSVVGLAHYCLVSPGSSDGYASMGGA